MPQRLLLSSKYFLRLKPDLRNHHHQLLIHFNPSTPIHFSTSSLSLFSPYHELTSSISVNALTPRQSGTASNSKHQLFVQILALCTFSSILLFLRLISAVLLPDFPSRWRNLLTFCEEAEARTCAYPSHVWKAIVAYEDRRFFTHFGVDLVGIARATVSFSALGGGSTITQQQLISI
ncbi:hypothetical protein F8388_018779 [Cannabis sativa]|uniref:Glycosyl transferase family 51 domain-containing protein n=1 Tax=Cannabis sativa TaxID=3483 RepID=A0A7J6DQY1_CANSA|nr:hypothetical protein G4B88_017170 [Cannabis sativa]KAF4384027.1 hypothetical protein F8388_018779 [Cannabis sativa]